jgi:glycosyltransferase involved in cell wall biosynthesis
MRAALLLEQTLGHRSHSSNLVSALAESRLDADVLSVEFRQSALRVPWAFRGSWQASRALGHSVGRHDVRFYHTQTVSLFAPFRSRSPYVVSVDATPLQIDAFGRWYGHSLGRSPTEALKRRWYRLVFARAAALVAWSNWAADSLVADYGVPRSKILVAHPGAPASLFELERRPSSGRPVVLFVGGDFQRKGGDLLLNVFQRIKDEVRLILVTGAEIPEMPGVEVIGDAVPGSARLLDAYARADIFCLPTRGDCTPLVLGEAMAAGLPVVTTRIGSNCETIREGEDGFVIEVNDELALMDALSRLAADPALRHRIGLSARARAQALFSSSRNAARIFQLLETVAR